eukprot:TRINITY_DN62403_c0_g1_i1.p1 TRINITY_DN62403_c0_g1~~TRINITY_DN62403_c0_g1_i1.p1  ORF type:complete len:364 (-),score=35.49 TRINITY_DN62403_c0_g1_i1:6-1097(-)
MAALLTPRRWQLSPRRWHREMGFRPPADFASQAQREFVFTAEDQKQPSTARSRRSAEDCGSSDEDGSNVFFLDSTDSTKRSLRLPGNVYGLAVAACVDPAFSKMQRLIVMALMVTNALFQGALIYTMERITESHTERSVCDCSRLVQWLSVVLYNVVVWEEIAVSLEMMEFVLRSSLPEPSDVAASTEASSSQQWIHYLGSEISPSGDDGWLKCSNFYHCLNEDSFLDVLEDGYRVNTMSRWTKRGLLAFIVLPKLALELAMLYVGSHYVGAAKSDESTINSVVAVNFIIGIDELFLAALVSGRMREALENTQPMFYIPQGLLQKLWARSRTNWRMLIDPSVICTLATLSWRHSLHLAGCPDF